MKGAIRDLTMVINDYVSSDRKKKKTKKMFRNNTKDDLLQASSRTNSWLRNRSDITEE